MLMQRSRLTAVLVVAMVVVAACGTAKKATTPTPRPTPSATPTATPVPTPVPLAAPLMIQVENLSDARPQSGLSQADVVYEYQTEGGISRFTTVFFHLPVGQVGPVRSARLATIKLLGIWGGTLLYSGGSHYVSVKLYASGYRQYNEGRAAGTLFRISSRFAPHNLYTNGGHLAAFQQRIGPHVVGYQLWERTPVASLPPSLGPLLKFQVPISSSERPIFTYDAASGAYTRVEPGTGLLTDADNRAPWRPTTVVVLQMAITVGPEVEDVSGTHGLDFGLLGSGTGQVAVGGQVYPVTWTQGASGPPQLIMQNGQPAPIAPGQVLVELVPGGQPLLAR